MLQEARRLFFTPSRNAQHRLRQQATITFLLVWLVCMLFIISTSFLIVWVQALVVLNTAASLAAVVVTQALCSRAGTQQNYPLTFGLFRLSTVIRLGSIIFLVFGCVTTVVESIHRGMHSDHHSNPFFLLALGGLQLVAHLVFRREVRLADRVTGHRGMAGAQSEDILHQGCAASCSEGRAVGRGGFFEDYRHGPGAAGPAGSPTGSPAASGSLSAAQRAVHSRSAAFARFLLCPLVCIAASILMLVLDSALPDTAAALGLAVYYAFVGYRQGSELLDLLMNKCVTDPRRLRSLERCLRNVKMLDGVLQVQSTVWWNVNVSDSMLFVRVRLMSGCNASGVSQAVRKQLAELATYVYVECFPANGANGLSESAQLSWAPPPSQAHGHSHGEHGHSHDGAHGHSHGEEVHDHSHDNGHGHDHGHSHGYEGEQEHAHDHGHEHVHHSGGAAGYGNVVAETNGLTRRGGTNNFPGPASGTAPYGAAALQVPPMSFPAPPLQQVSGSSVFRTPYAAPPQQQQYQPSPPPQLPSAAVSGAAPTAFWPAPPYVMSGSGAQVNAVPAPTFPHAPMSPYGTSSSGGVDSRYGQPQLRGPAASAGAGGGFPAAPATRTLDMPPPSFPPFREHSGRGGGA